MRRPRWWFLFPYYLVGTRIPVRYRAWVERDVARSYWPRFVPRLRLFFLLSLGVAIFAGPWNDALDPAVRTGLMLAPLITWVLPGKSGDADRQMEIMFQRGLIDSTKRFSYLIKAATVAGTVSDPSDPPAPIDELRIEHIPRPVGGTRSEVRTSVCRVCASRIQKDEAGWRHYDDDWDLFECAGCGWQDIDQTRCPSCGRCELTKNQRQAPKPSFGRRLYFGVYVSGLVALAAWWIVSRLLR